MSWKAESSVGKVVIAFPANSSMPNLSVGDSVQVWGSLDKHLLVSYRSGNSDSFVVVPSFHIRLLDNNNLELVEDPFSETSELSPVTIKMDRGSRLWRSNLKKALSSSDPEAYDRIKTQTMQFTEWRRKMIELEKENLSSTDKMKNASHSLANVVSESILNLVESTTQTREGLVIPRTETDEPATEDNTGSIRLMALHIESEQRVFDGTHVPTSASESLMHEISRGLHGGPTISNEKATDISGIWSTATSEAVVKEVVPLKRLADGLAFETIQPPSSNVVQLLVDIKPFVSFNTLDTPSYLNICLYDSLTGESISDNALIHMFVNGVPLFSRSEARRRLAAATIAANSSVDVDHDPSVPVISYLLGEWYQVLFSNVPRDLLTSGRIFVVFKAFRVGSLSNVVPTAAQSTLKHKSSNSLSFHGKSNIKSYSTTSTSVPTGSMYRSFRSTGNLANDSSADLYPSDIPYNMVIQSSSGSGSSSLGAAGHCSASSSSTAAPIRSSMKKMSSKRLSKKNFEESQISHSVEYSGYRASIPLGMLARQRFVYGRESRIGKNNQQSSSGSVSHGLGSSMSKLRIPSLNRNRLRQLQKRFRSARYSRIIGVAVAHVPPMAVHLSQGTPFCPSEPITFHKSANKEEHRFWRLHESLFGLYVVNRPSSNDSQDSATQPANSTVPGGNFEEREPVIRVPGINVLPCVFRAFSTDLKSVLSDPNLRHLMSPAVRNGSVCMPRYSVLASVGVGSLGYSSLSSSSSTPGSTPHVRHNSATFDTAVESALAFRNPQNLILMKSLRPASTLDTVKSTAIGALLCSGMVSFGWSPAKINSYLQHITPTLHSLSAVHFFMRLSGLFHTYGGSFMQLKRFAGFDTNIIQFAEQKLLEGISGGFSTLRSLGFSDDNGVDLISSHQGLTIESKDASGSANAIGRSSTSRISSTQNLIRRSLSISTSSSGALSQTFSGAQTTVVNSNSNLHNRMSENQVVPSLSAHSLAGGNSVSVRDEDAVNILHRLASDSVLNEVDYWESLQALFCRAVAPEDCLLPDPSSPSRTVPSMASQFFSSSNVLPGVNTNSNMTNVSNSSLSAVGNVHVGALGATFMHKVARHIFSLPQPLNMKPIVRCGLDPSSEVSSHYSRPESQGIQTEESKSEGINLNYVSSHDFPTEFETLQITLRRGIFATDKKKITPRNIQIRASVITSTGEIIPAITRGTLAHPAHSVADDTTRNSLSGMNNQSDDPYFQGDREESRVYLEYCSAVYYHSNVPQFDETITVRLRRNDFASSHLLIQYVHSSTTPANSHAFAFSVLPLTDAAGCIIRDGIHQLLCFQTHESLSNSIISQNQNSASVDSSSSKGVSKAPSKSSHGLVNENTTLRFGKNRKKASTFPNQQDATTNVLKNQYPPASKPARGWEKMRERINTESMDSVKEDIVDKSRLILEGVPGYLFAGVQDHKGRILIPPYYSSSLLAAISSVESDNPGKSTLREQQCHENKVRELLGRVFAGRHVPLSALPVPLGAAVSRKKRGIPQHSVEAAALFSALCRVMRSSNVSSVLGTHGYGVPRGWLLDPNIVELELAADNILSANATDLNADKDYIIEEDQSEGGDDEMDGSSVHLPENSEGQATINTTSPGVIADHSLVNENFNPGLGYGFQPTYHYNYVTSQYRPLGVGRHNRRLSDVSDGPDAFGDARNRGNGSVSGDKGGRWLSLLRRRNRESIGVAEPITLRPTQSGKPTVVSESHSRASSNVQSSSIQNSASEKSSTSQRRRSIIEVFTSPRKESMSLAEGSPKSRNEESSEDLRPRDDPAVEGELDTVSEQEEISSGDSSDNGDVDASNRARSLDVSLREVLLPKEQKDVHKLSNADDIQGGPIQDNNSKLKSSPFFRITPSLSKTKRATVKPSLSSSKRIKADSLDSLDSQSDDSHSDESSMSSATVSSSVSMSSRISRGLSYLRSSESRDRKRDSTKGSRGFFSAFSSSLSLQHQNSTAAQVHTFSSSPNLILRKDVFIVETCIVPSASTNSRPISPIPEFSSILHWRALLKSPEGKRIFESPSDQKNSNGESTHLGQDVFPSNELSASSFLRSDYTVPRLLEGLRAARLICLHPVLLQMHLPSLYRSLTSMIGSLRLDPTESKSLIPPREYCSSMCSSDADPFDSASRDRSLIFSFGIQLLISAFFTAFPGPTFLSPTAITPIGSNGGLAGAAGHTAGSADDDNDRQGLSFDENEVNNLNFGSNLPEKSVAESSNFSMNLKWPPLKNTRLPLLPPTPLGSNAEQLLNMLLSAPPSKDTVNSLLCVFLGIFRSGLELSTPLTSLSDSLIIDSSSYCDSYGAQGILPDAGFTYSTAKQLALALPAFVEAIGAASAVHFNFDEYSRRMGASDISSHGDSDTDDMYDVDETANEDEEAASEQIEADIKQKRFSSFDASSCDLFSGSVLKSGEINEEVEVPKESVSSSISDPSSMENVVVISPNEKDSSSPVELVCTSRPSVASVDMVRINNPPAEDLKNSLLADSDVTLSSFVSTPSTLSSFAIPPRQIAAPPPGTPIPSDRIEPNDSVQFVSSAPISTEVSSGRRSLTYIMNNRRLLLSLLISVCRVIKRVPSPLYSPDWLLPIQASLLRSFPAMVNSLNLKGLLSPNEVSSLLLLVLETVPPTHWTLLRSNHVSSLVKLNKPFHSSSLSRIYSNNSNTAPATGSTQSANTEGSRISRPSISPQPNQSTPAVSSNLIQQLLDETAAAASSRSLRLSMLLCIRSILIINAPSLDKGPNDTSSNSSNSTNFGSHSSSKWNLSGSSKQRQKFYSLVKSLLGPITAHLGAQMNESGEQRAVSLRILIAIVDTLEKNEEIPWNPRMKNSEIFSTFGRGAASIGLRKGASIGSGPAIAMSIGKGVGGSAARRSIAISLSPAQRLSYLRPTVPGMFVTSPVASSATNTSNSSETMGDGTINSPKLKSAHSSVGFAFPSTPETMADSSSSSHPTANTGVEKEGDSFSNVSGNMIGEGRSPVEESLPVSFAAISPTFLTLSSLLSELTTALLYLSKGEAAPGDRHLVTGKYRSEEESLMVRSRAFADLPSHVLYLDKESSKAYSPLTTTYLSLHCSKSALNGSDSASFEKRRVSSETCSVDISASPVVAGTPVSQTRHSGSRHVRATRSLGIELKQTSPFCGPHDPLCCALPLDVFQEVYGPDAAEPQPKSSNSSWDCGLGVGNAGLHDIVGSSPIRVHAHTLHAVQAAEGIWSRGIELHQLISSYSSVQDLPVRSAWDVSSHPVNARTGSGSMCHGLNRRTSEGGAIDTMEGIAFSHPRSSSLSSKGSVSLSTSIPPIPTTPVASTSADSHSVYPNPSLTLSGNHVQSVSGTSTPRVGRSFNQHVSRSQEVNTHSSSTLSHSLVQQLWQRWDENKRAAALSYRRVLQIIITNGEDISTLVPSYLYPNSGVSNSTFEDQNSNAEEEVRRAHAASAFLENQFTACMAVWSGLLWRIPDPVGYILLAKLGPVLSSIPPTLIGPVAFVPSLRSGSSFEFNHHFVLSKNERYFSTESRGYNSGSLAESAPQESVAVDSKQESDVYIHPMVAEFHRLKFALQLLRTSFLILKTSSISSSWLSVNMQLLRSIFKVFRWCAQLLASAHQGFDMETPDFLEWIDFLSSTTTSVRTSGGNRHSYSSLNSGSGSSVSADSSDSVLDDTFFFLNHQFERSAAPTSKSNGGSISGSVSLPLPLRRSTKPSWTIARPVWVAFLDLFFALVSSPLFSPESLKSARSQAVLERYGDYRGAVCAVFREAVLGSAGVNHIPSVPQNINFEGSTGEDKSMDGYSSSPLHDPEVKESLSSFMRIISSISVGINPNTSLTKSLLSNPPPSIGSFTSPSPQIIAQFLPLQLPRRFFHHATTPLWKFSDFLPHFSFYLPDVDLSTETSVMGGVDGKSGAQLDEFSSVRHNTSISLRNYLAPLLIAPILNLAYCSNADVALFAREAFFDLLEAELLLNTKKKILLWWQYQRLINILQRLLIPSLSTQQDIVVKTNNQVEKSFADNDSMSSKHDQADIIPPQNHVYSNRLSASDLARIADMHYPHILMSTLLSTKDIPPPPSSPLSLLEYLHSTKVRHFLMSQFSLFSKPSEIERLTVDAIDLIISQGPSLVVAPPSSGITGTSNLGISTSNLTSTNPLTQGVGHWNSALPSSLSLLAILLHHQGETHLPSGLQKPEVIEFISSARRIFTMLAAVTNSTGSSGTARSETNELERSASALLLISALRRSHRMDLYHRHVQLLHDHNLRLGHNVEAALTSLLHIDIPAQLSAPSNLSSPRGGSNFITGAFGSSTHLLNLTESEEKIVLDAVRILASEQHWEHAQRLCRLLLASVEPPRQLIHVNRAATLLRTCADLKDSFLAKARIFRPYFVIVPTGPLVPLSLRCRAIALRGHVGERVADFENRMKQMFDGFRICQMQLPVLELAAMVLRLRANRGANLATSSSLTVDTSLNNTVTDVRSFSTSTFPKRSHTLSKRVSASTSISRSISLSSKLRPTSQSSTKDGVDQNHSTSTDPFTRSVSLSTTFSSSVSSPLGSPSTSQPSAHSEGGVKQSVGDLGRILKNTIPYDRRVYEAQLVTMEELSQLEEYISPLLSEMSSSSSSMADLHAPQNTMSESIVWYGSINVQQRTVEHDPFPLVFGSETAPSYADLLVGINSYGAATIPKSDMYLTSGDSTVTPRSPLMSSPLLNSPGVPPPVLPLGPQGLNSPTHSLGTTGPLDSSVATFAGTMGASPPGAGGINSVNFSSPSSSLMGNSPMPTTLGLVRSRVLAFSTGNMAPVGSNSGENSLDTTPANSRPVSAFVTSGEPSQKPDAEADPTLAVVPDVVTNSTIESMNIIADSTVDVTNKAESTRVEPESLTILDLITPTGPSYSISSMQQSNSTSNERRRILSNGSNDHGQLPWLPSLFDIYGLGDSRGFLMDSHSSEVVQPELEIPTLSESPEALRLSYSHHFVRRFLYQRTFTHPVVLEAKARAKMLGQPYAANQFLDLWVRRFHICTQMAFPGFAMHSDSVHIESVVLNPVEAAISTLLDKTATLRDLAEEAQQKDDRGGGHAFTQAIVGVVDAAVSGGLSNYEPFFSGSFAWSHPEIAVDMWGEGWREIHKSMFPAIAHLHSSMIDASTHSDDLSSSTFPPGSSSNMKAGLAEEGMMPKRMLLETLNNAVIEQLVIVAKCIRIHAAKCPEDILPLHAYICEKFSQLKVLVVKWGVTARSQTPFKWTE